MSFEQDILNAKKSDAQQKNLGLLKSLRKMLMGFVPRLVVMLVLYFFYGTLLAYTYALGDYPALFIAVSVLVIAQLQGWGKWSK
jgi:hypothetical protein